MTKTTTPLYPVFLKLEGLEVVVVGGGPVALSKLDGLLAAGAHVTVIAPHVLPEIRTKVTVLETTFRPEHLAGARWVVAAATPMIEASGRETPLGMPHASNTGASRFEIAGSIV